ncbi:hypothetical protein BJ742DRAFT_766747 [Cladochytrium replicatum]|nr:hypothetical protein BJ742DRAFT_766747 [Cladochytrium replicatum]
MSSEATVPTLNLESPLPMHNSDPELPSYSEAIGTTSTSQRFDDPPDVPAHLVSTAHLGPPVPSGIQRLLVVTLTKATTAVCIPDGAMVHKANVFNKVHRTFDEEVMVTGDGRTAGHVDQMTILCGSEFATNTLFQSKSQHTFTLTDRVHCSTATNIQKSGALVGPPKFAFSTQDGGSYEWRQSFNPPPIAGRYKPPSEAINNGGIV